MRRRQFFQADQVAGHYRRRTEYFHAAANPAGRNRCHARAGHILCRAARTDCTIPDTDRLLAELARHHVTTCIQRGFAADAGQVGAQPMRLVRAGGTGSAFAPYLDAVIRRLCALQRHDDNILTIVEAMIRTAGTRHCAMHRAGAIGVEVGAA